MVSELSLSGTCSRRAEIWTLQLELGRHQRLRRKTVNMHTTFSRVTRLQLLRSYATTSSGSSSVNPYTVGPFQVFDRKIKRLQRDRAASRDNGRRSRTVDYVRDEIADMMMERFLVRTDLTSSALLLIHFQDIKRSFGSVLDIGAGAGHFSKLLEPENTRRSIMLDLSRASLIYLVKMKP